MRSIKAKLIALYAAVVLVVMTVSGTFMLFTMRNMEIAHTEDRLFSHAEDINTRVVQVYAPPFSAASWFELGQSGYDVEGFILDSVGIVIAPPEFAGLNLHPHDNTVVAALAGTSDFSQGSVGLDQTGRERQWLTFAMPAELNEETFIIFTRIDTQFLNETLSRLTLTFVTTVLIALVITVIMWFFLSNTLTNPIVELSRHARAIATGDLSLEIKSDSKDEIGELRTNFNYMAKELRATISSMVKEKNKSEAILHNSSHGVLAYDAEGYLTHANNAITELLHGVEIRNHLNFALEFLRFNPEDLDLLKPGEIWESTHEEGEYYLSAAITSYSNDSGVIEGYIIVMQDISRQRKLDNMRKEFVANVSHELRTPLTSIKTYSETLLDGAMEDTETAKKFLKVINEEAERMTLLVSDLLELSRIDSKQSSLEIDIVDIVALIRLSIRQAYVQAEQKNQEIIFEPPETPYFIEANAARINQVIYNILSNSIKYSGENTVIKITLETTEKFYRVFVKDNGIGIPQESLSQVFERFYRVDKARARAMGGTGLGLAIVKEIMEEHGGRVYATSQLSHGTTMVLRFNKLQED